MGDGFLLLVALALVWPLGAGLVTAVRGPRRERRWRYFAVAAVAATVVGVVLFVVSLVTFAADGTTGAMVSLGMNIGAIACLVGAILSGVVAGILRHTPPPG
ncbi:hypothetical protein [Egicoccus halophilus]|uniref:Uncharacterized protein n=1 Tax=Egicoccus halophilus TaxID=1670830 RepID=A0A8J3A9M0_9ACTN|nr:hypothetical protein [Egicoccus halophilus]GGI08188.1 hypothetical protein GCM10011354_27840 [Egicoccus halophilus]